ncbi:MAG TPA: hypothetical protein VK662_13310, partial [Acidothermaceae bacterium]|nr:hypothetical protein [Acidothermaceae bacterium]
MPSASSRRIAAFAATITVGGLLIAMPGTAVADPQPVVTTYGYTGSTDTFTVPAGITQLTVSLAGGEGGQGGTDSSGPSAVGGYQGVVSGTITVSPGQILTVAVGQGGATGAGSAAGSNVSGHYTDGAAAGGLSPLAGYLG